jgi:hypothetical protein
MKKGQVSIETIFIVGISTILLMPAMYLFYEFLSQSSEDIISNQIDNIGNTFAENARKMYYYGNNAKINVDFSFPDKIYNMSIEQNSYLIINVNTQNGIKEFMFPLKINATGTFNESHFHQGYQSFEFKTIKQGEQVLITPK